jgi:predicted alpha/beta-hydrolase family hydrolase
MEIVTGYGRARAEVDEPCSPLFLLVLTHGAGGGVDSPDLLAARDAGRQLGGAVARVIQPYRVRGASAPGSTARQDAAWLEIIGSLRGRFPGIPLVQGGRSNGARVACGTARRRRRRPGGERER